MNDKDKNKSIVHKNRRTPVNLKKSNAGRKQCRPPRTGGYWLIDDVHIPRIEWLKKKLRKERDDKNISKADIMNDALASHLDIEGVPYQITENKA